ncbi:MAG: AtpZ/AtpI family protein [Isosphaerales bacterium]
MSDLERDEGPFVREIRRQAERARIGQHLTFWQGLGLVGSVGWMVVLPALVGAFLGRWIDRRCATGVFWTLSLLMLGLALGCLSAWRQVDQELRR